MFSYIVKRIMAMVPTFVGITLMTFLVINLAPGGPVEQFLREVRFGQVQTGSTTGSGSGIENAGVTGDTLRELKAQFGYDKPVLERYFIWLGNLLRLDFGRSFVHDVPAIEVIASKFPVSLQFGITSFLLTYLVCIPLGVWKAVHDGQWEDTSTSALVFTGYAVSPLMLGIVLIVVFGGGVFDWFPISGSVSDLHDELGFFARIQDRIHHAILPLGCYLAGNFAALTLLMKNAFLEEMNKPYAITAIAKGLPMRTVRYSHVLRNAMIPIATGLGSFLGIFFAGNLFIEQIFSLDGMGLLFYQALLARDYPILLGSLSLISMILMLGNLISDMLYVILDPRIDFD